MKHKYPIGTKVKFIYPNKDKGKLGTIVGTDDRDFAYEGEIRYLVVIPTTFYTYMIGIGKIEYTWRCLPSQIELVNKPNTQLLFEFMNEE